MPPPKAPHSTNSKTPPTGTSQARTPSTSATVDGTHQPRSNSNSGPPNSQQPDTQHLPPRADLVIDAISARPTLTAEQAHLLSGVTRSGAPVDVVVGWASTARPSTSTLKSVSYMPYNQDAPHSPSTSWKNSVPPSPTNLHSHSSTATRSPQKTLKYSQEEQSIQQKQDAKKFSSNSKNINKKPSPTNSQKKKRTRSHSPHPSSPPRPTPTRRPQHLPALYPQTKKWKYLFATISQQKQKTTNNDSEK